MASTELTAPLSFLSDIPRYKTEKPFYELRRPPDGFNCETATEAELESLAKKDNLQFSYNNVSIGNIRGREANFRLESCGFEVVHHASQLADQLMISAEAIQAYKNETEELLRERFNAEHVLCFEARLRKNQPFSGRVYDLSDPLLVEGPAIGAHTDFTVDSGPRSMDNCLSDEAKATYLSSEYRFRILNTWRGLIPEIEDNPLAVCDYRTVDNGDLVAADRLIPTRIGEIYYVQYSRNQKWYWLEKMKPDEPFLMVMYDSDGRGNALFCPHISFQNPEAPGTAQGRVSIETRTIVITKKEEGRSFADHIPSC